MRWLTGYCNPPFGGNNECRNIKVECFEDLVASFQSHLSSQSPPQLVSSFNVNLFYKFSYRLVCPVFVLFVSVCRVSRCLSQACQFSPILVRLLCQNVCVTFTGILVVFVLPRICVFHCALLSPIARCSSVSAFVPVPSADLSAQPSERRIRVDLSQCRISRARWCQMQRLLKWTPQQIRWRRYSFQVWKQKMCYESG